MWNHTFVDPSLRGQGVAEQLVDRVVEEMQKEQKKIKPVVLM
ncbi:MAG: N-acetyltransferase [Alkalibacterium thalassium]|nr:N-acetyltransferase [Alkalibacterium thalassium]